jgi:cytochrome c oxidase subunit III
MEHSIVAHQFEDADQQREVSTLGMWTFLATEVLFFGAVLVAYTVYRHRYPEEFRRGSLDLKWYFGGFNTAVLLVSSFFMAMAVHAAQLGNHKKLVRNLWLTIILGAMFLGVKAIEYYTEYKEGLVPTASLWERIPPAEQQENAFIRGQTHFEHKITPESQSKEEKEPRPEQEKMFMSFYFILTGIHALHMIIGIGVMLTLLYLTHRGWFSREYHNPVEMAGLYWHFVDIVWVFLFPILYLLRNQ